MTKRDYQRWAPLFTVVVLLLALFLLRQCTDGEKEKPAAQVEKLVKGLNRNPEKINYSRHARCRMGCRQIDEYEVKEILAGGKINYAKSEIGDRPDCKRKYAVEGITRDRQRVRIIFAPCKNEVTVVTVIDIGKEWPCDCD
jgi:hypothetical protein